MIRKLQILGIIFIFGILAALVIIGLTIEKTAAEKAKETPPGPIFHELGDGTMLVRFEITDDSGEFTQIRIEERVTLKHDLIKDEFIAEGYGTTLQGVSRYTRLDAIVNLMKARLGLIKAEQPDNKLKP